MLLIFSGIAPPLHHAIGAHFRLDHPAHAPVAPTDHLDHLYRLVVLDHLIHHYLVVHRIVVEIFTMIQCGLAIQVSPWIVNTRQQA